MTLYWRPEKLKIISVFADSKDMMKKNAKNRMSQQQVAHDYLAMAQKYRHAGQHKKALNAIRVALNVWPKFAKAYNELGLVHRQLGESGEAISAYKKALRVDPGNATTALNLGICYLYEENEPAAIDCFKKAVRTKPRYAYAHFNLGSTYFDQARYVLAIDHLERAIKYDPYFLAPYEICAMAYLILKQKQKARGLFKKAEKIKRQARLKYAAR